VYATIVGVIKKRTQRFPQLFARESLFYYNIGGIIMFMDYFYDPERVRIERENARSLFSLLKNLILFGPDNMKDHRI